MADKIRELQRCILDIALEFQRICEKNGLKYFLTYGTLLGAVRHQGFIPWDDDMDVGMPREDYEKFLRIAPSELGEGFFLQTEATDPAYAFTSAKIRLNGTALVEDYAADSKQHNGIFLDVFPYDTLPKHGWQQWLHFRAAKCLKWAALGKTDYTFVKSKRRRFAKLMSAAFFFLRKDGAVRLSNKLRRFYERRHTGHYVDTEWYKSVVTDEDLVDMPKLSFEGYEFPVPHRYEQLLTKIYGDYMKLPPVEKRGVQHDVVRLDVGDYVIKNNASKERQEVCE